MKRRGVCYDVGRVLEGTLTRPRFDPRSVRRELEIIRNDLHCNAVRIQGQDVQRLGLASRQALELGLEVWFSPELFERGGEETLRYLVRAAGEAEALHSQWPERLVFSVGSELTLFMQGILPGRSLLQRLGNPHLWENIKAGKHDPPLNDFLRKANDAVRRVFHGKVTYFSLPWETVAWEPFDVIGVDHYWAERIQDRYVEMLQPFLAHGKPVCIGEFGFCTYQGAERAGGRAWNIVDYRSLFVHSLPIVGRLVRPRLNGTYVRDEGLQARALARQLRLLDEAGVDGAFVFTFSAPLSPYAQDPKYDLDMASYSLVRSLEGTHGSTYPDMSWEPKESFRAVADHYSKS